MPRFYEYLVLLTRFYKGEYHSISLEEENMNKNSIEKSSFFVMLVTAIVVLPSLSVTILSANAGDFKDDVHDVAVAQITEPEATNGTYDMPPGTITIAGIIQNLGAFNESGLACTVEITNIITTVYLETIANIDLGIGEQEDVLFPDATLYEEGTYTLTMSLPLENDSNLSNNIKTLTICVDASPPVVTLWFDPPGPNGCNGWYTVPVTFGFNVTEGCEVYYSLGNGSWILYTEPVTIHTSGIHTVCYYIIDEFGNAYPEHQFTIPIDREPPVVIISKQFLTNRIKFSVEAYDNISGMMAVEFYLLDVLQYSDTDESNGWSFILHPIPHGNYTLTAVAIDGACNRGSSNTTVLPYTQQDYPTLQGFLLKIQLILKSLREYHKGLQ
jgi:hypothetical protein